MFGVNTAGQNLPAAEQSVVIDVKDDTRSVHSYDVEQRVEADQPQSTSTKGKKKKLKKNRRSIDWEIFWLGALMIFGLLLFIAGALSVIFFNALGPIIFLIGFGGMILGVFTMISVLAIDGGGYDNMASAFMLIFGMLGIGIVGALWGLIGLFIWLL